MTLRQACWLASGLFFVAACGGSVFTGDDGSGAKSNGGSNSHAGSTSTSGTGSGGASSSGGTRGMGKAGTNAGGSVSVAGTVGIGGMNCTLVDCAYPACEDGQEPVTKPGECCPTCPPPPLTGCESVMCKDDTQCPAGYKPGRPPGACCNGCVPDGQIACVDIACPTNNCPLGYTQAGEFGGCCYDCVPDPKYCNTAADCILADRPRSCCGCPEAISKRTYAADDCWSSPDMPRMIPQDCYPAAVCDAICGACPPPGKAICAEHRCIEMGLK